MSLTATELKALDLGYLKGSDLLQFCAAQLLIKQYEVDNDSLQAGSNLAYSELESNLSTRYDVKTELENSTRNALCVKIASILAIRNILGNAQNISEMMINLFVWADKELIAIRNGQISLGLNQPQNTDGTPVLNYSDASLIRSSFKTIG